MMKLILLALILLQATLATTTEITIRHYGLTRRAEIYVPASYDPEEAMPLVIAFHPAGGSAETMAQLTHFNEYAESEGFMVLYPQGYYGYFDYGAGYDSWADAPDLVDDPGFMLQLVEEVQAAYTIDQIYAVGFSNGARMAFRLGCDLPLAGIAAVAATISDEVTTHCEADNQPRVLFMHGTADGVIPWGGKPLYIGSQFISNALSAPDTAAFWAAHNGCTTEINTQEAASIRWTISYQTAGDCEGDVRFYTVENGGHQWFRDDIFDASTEIIQFFFAERS